MHTHEPNASSCLSCSASSSRALENGRQVAWLSRHLGHSSLKVTTDIYGHWERAERKREAELMEGVFGV
jgi:integrase